MSGGTRYRPVLLQGWVLDLHRALEKAVPDLDRYPTFRYVPVRLDEDGVEVRDVRVLAVRDLDDDPGALEEDPDLHHQLLHEHALAVHPYDWFSR